MIRRAARWYLVALGVALAVCAFQAARGDGLSSVQCTFVAVSGVALVLGGAAGIMRLPGRVPAAYLGIGAGIGALVQLAGALSGYAGLGGFVAGVYLAVALLVIASWSLWPSTG